MTIPLHQHSGKTIESAQQVLNAALFAFDHSSDADPSRRAVRPFVTVSRQPGAGAISFSHHLADRLNQNGAKDWLAWDRELVEKVSAEHGIDKEIIQTISTRRHNWLIDILESFSVSHDPGDVTEARAYKRVIMTVRALAAAGHAILVGRAGAFITKGMPGAVHLRLVAPLEYRIRQVAEREQISIHEAGAWIADAEQARSDFYRRYWPGQPLKPENYTLTLNAAELSLDEMVECVLPIVRARQSCRNCPRCGKDKCAKADATAAPAVAV
jgi:cytidylate kinase